MAIIDIIALIFIGFSAFQGFRSKTGTQVWALIALLAGVVLASLFTPSFSNYLNFISDPSLRSAFTFVIIFILVHQGIQFLAQLFKLNFSLGAFDPLGGLLFAIVESSLFVGIIGLALMKVHEVRFLVENSQIVSKLAKIAQSVIISLGAKF
jgi:Colicin V production protein.